MRWLLPLIGCACLGMASTADAADLCAPLDNLRKRDIKEAPALYKSCRDANELFDRVNADLEMHAMFDESEMESFIVANKTIPNYEIHKKALTWNNAVNQAVRQNAGALLLLGRAVKDDAKQIQGDPELADPRRHGRLEAALAAQARVNSKGENLKRYLLIQSDQIQSITQLERALNAFFEEEPVAFRAPASID